MDKIQSFYPVVSNQKLSPCFYRLCFDAPQIVKTVQPGQFVHIRVHDGLEPFFRRPFSVYRAQKHVEIFYEAIGPGTEILTKKKKGDLLDVLGPLGTPFRLPSEDVEDVVMIAGGIGVAPFLILSDVLKARKCRLILLYGGRTAGHVYDMKEFKKNGCQIHVATDDGSIGVKGRVSKLFSKIPCNPETTMIYTCGPHAMMAAVQDFARQKRMSGQAACEEVMACALGACLGCSVKTTSGYQTCCYDGPAFELGEVIF
ncbi:MAG: dihydroorotate dehydrogenase electron transfer subunit [Candidatus Omnitrophica bacterium]|nr:dihydroorotate dehydrogenase electron transfer subunit [Candidatus Omnitrophota bacterium]